MNCRRLLNEAQHDNEKLRVEVSNLKSVLLQLNSDCEKEFFKRKARDAQLRENYIEIVAKWLYENPIPPLLNGLTPFDWDKQDEDFKNYYCRRAKELVALLSLSVEAGKK